MFNAFILNACIYLEINFACKRIFDQLYSPKDRLTSNKLKVVNYRAIYYIIFSLETRIFVGDLNTLCHSCGLDHQQKGLKKVSGSWVSPLRGWGSLTMSFTGKFVCIWLTISSCYGSIPLNLVMIGRDDSLSTPFYSCGFDYQHRVLKTFPGFGCLHSEDDVVWLWVPFVLNVKYYIIIQWDISLKQ